MGEAIVLDLVVRDGPSRDDAQLLRKADLLAGRARPRRPRHGRAPGRPARAGSECRERCVRCERNARSCSLKRDTQRAMRLALAVILLTACGGSDAKLPTGPIAATVTDYDLTIDLDSRATHAKVTATVTEAGDCWQLPFRGAAPANVTMNGKLAEASRRRHHDHRVRRGLHHGKPLVLDARPHAAADDAGDDRRRLLGEDRQRSERVLLSAQLDRRAAIGSRRATTAPISSRTYHYDVTHPATHGALPGHRHRRQRDRDHVRLHSSTAARPTRRSA